MLFTEVTPQITAQLNAFLLLTDEFEDREVIKIWRQRVKDGAKLSPQRVARLVNELATPPKTRKEVRSVACPACGAKRYRYCKRWSAKTEEFYYESNNHVERIQAFEESWQSPFTF